MRRLTIFAKGNLDVRDCLHSCRIDGGLVWNGLNEVLRDRHPGVAAHMRHEIWTRSDALLQPTEEVPAELARRSLPLGPYTAAAQFSRALFKTDADAVVLSVQPDLMTGLVRHRRESYLFYPNDWQSWPGEDQEWLRREFVHLAPLSPAESMANFEAIILRLRERSNAPILIFNASSIVPGEWVHAHGGLEDILSTRIRRFNLALIELSQRTGISIVDVDAIVARGGADRLKYDALHLTADGCRMIAEGVARILDDLGCFASPAVNPCA